MRRGAMQLCRRRRPAHALYSGATARPAAAVALPQRPQQAASRMHTLRRGPARAVHVGANGNGNDAAEARRLYSTGSSSGGDGDGDGEVVDTLEELAKVLGVNAGANVNAGGGEAAVSAEESAATIDRVARRLLEVESVAQQDFTDDVNASHFAIQNQLLADASDETSSWIDLMMEEYVMHRQDQQPFTPAVPWIRNPNWGTDELFKFPEEVAVQSRAIGNGGGGFNNGKGGGGGGRVRRNEPVDLEAPERQRLKCVFCHAVEPPVIDEVNGQLMKKFMSSTGRILPRNATGTCAKHQRKVSRAIKRARSQGFFSYKKAQFEVNAPYWNVRAQQTPLDIANANAAAGSAARGAAGAWTRVDDGRGGGGGGGGGGKQSNSAPPS